MPAYKDIDRGTWYAQFYYRDYTGQNKLKKKRGFQRKRDAEQWEREFLNTQNGSSNMKLRSLCELYLQDSETRLKASTMQTKQSLMENWVVPKLGEIPINQLTAVQVRKWQTELLTSGLSETYVKTIHNQLSALCNYGVAYYGMPVNPARQAGPVGKKYADEMQIWTVEEFTTVLEAIEEPQAKTALLVLFWSGLRVGELLGLTLRDIDFTPGSATIAVNRTYCRIAGQDYLQTPKTAKSRRKVPIPDKVADAIKAYAATKYGLGKNDRIFDQLKTYYHAAMGKACKKVGMKKIRLHDLRHSHASLLIHHNVPVLMVSQRLGHEDIQTTLRTYGHLYPNTTADTVELMNSLVG